MRSAKTEEFGGGIIVPLLRGSRESDSNCPDSLDAGLHERLHELPLKQEERHQ